MSEGTGVAPPAPAPAQPQLQLNAQQLAAVLLIDALIQGMQVAANQLGGFMGFNDAANIILHAQRTLGNDYEAMKQRWAKKVQLVPAGALPPDPKPA